MAEMTGLPKEELVSGGVNLAQFRAALCSRKRRTRYELAVGLQKDVAALPLDLPLVAFFSELVTV